MSPDQAHILMELRGYSRHWTTPTREYGGYVKEIDGVTIYAEVSASGNNVELSYVLAPARGLRVTTGSFALNHPHFDKYESYVTQAALLLCGSQW